jgi:hypothetical protein
MHRSLPCELAARARANLTGINPAIGVQDYASNLRRQLGGGHDQPGCT